MNTNPPPTLRPMIEFDPTQPATLHERSTGRVITWTGEEADDYRKEAAMFDDGSVSWRHMRFDGWAEVLGG